MRSPVVVCISLPHFLCCVCHHPGVLFDVLFNLHKFMRFETRDPFQEKLRREDIYHSDWDRFAHVEYNRLAQEEEGYDASMEVDMTHQQMLEEETSSAGGTKYQQGLGNNGSGVDQMSSWSLNDDDDDSDSERNIHRITDDDDDDDDDIQFASSGSDWGRGNAKR
jgi:hypothetical protein